MRIADVELYSSGSLEPISVLISAPTTNPSWLVQSLAQRFPNSESIQLGVAKPVFGAYKDRVLFVQNCELPILAGQSSADELVSQLQRLAVDNRVVVCVTLSEALVDKHYATGKELSRFAVRILYEASLVMRLQPLKTGRARDITGRFIVARGPKSQAADLVERDLFYYIGVRGAVELRERS